MAASRGAADSFIHDEQSKDFDSWKCQLFIYQWVSFCDSESHCPRAVKPFVNFYGWRSIFGEGTYSKSSKLLPFQEANHDHAKKRCWEQRKSITGHRSPLSCGSLGPLSQSFYFISLHPLSSVIDRTGKRVLVSCVHSASADWKPTLYAISWRRSIQASLTNWHQQSRPEGWHASWSILCWLETSWTNLFLLELMASSHGRITSAMMSPARWNLGIAFD